MDFEIVNPRKSCGNGGRKIYMICKSPILQDTEPFFLIYDKNGQRLLCEEYLLSQPKRDRNFLVVHASIILMTPSQPNLDIILRNAWTIKLGARSQSDAVEAMKSFEFSFASHPTEMACIFCDMHVD